MRDALKTNRAAALTALHGLGGIGKTQLAMEYAHRHASEYDIVWWMHSENPATLAADFARLAQSLNLVEKDAQDQRIVIEAVKRALQQSAPYLLIFDNATSQDEVYPFLPEGGHILITSRQTAWRGIANPLAVTKLPRAEAVAFLLKRTRGQTSKVSQTLEVYGDADKLADALGDLPLALEQAGAYCDACGASLAEYLALFAARRLELLKDFKPLDYPDTVLTTWNLAFEQIARDANAASLLNLCAFFAPDDIPRDLLVGPSTSLRSAQDVPSTSLRSAQDAPPLPKDDLEFNAALIALRRYSFIRSDNSLTLSVHRLVQAVTRDRMSDDDRKRFAASATRIVDAAFPSGNFQDDPATWDTCARLLPHALAAADYAAALEVAPEATARQFIRVGVYHQVRAQFADAKRLFERAIAIDESAYGENRPEVAIDINNLGSVLQDLGDLNGARECFERALKIDEATFGPNHPDVARDVNNLGAVLQALGDLNGARQCFERALKIDEAAFVPNHPNVAIRVNNLGAVLQDLGDLSGAHECFERALKIWESNLGANHPQVAIGVNNLGLVLKDLGDLNGAREHYERALKIFEATFGANHPNVASSVNNLGRVMQDLGDLNGARECFERALKIWESNLGANHPQVAIGVNNLGEVLRNLGDFDGARHCYERALKIWESNLGANHPQVAIGVNNLGLVLQALGDLNRARECFERALKIWESNLGANHPNVASSVNNLGGVLHALGDLNGAREHFERALKILTQFLPENHPNIKRVRGNLEELGK